MQPKQCFNLPDKRYYKTNEKAFVKTTKESISDVKTFGLKISQVVDFVKYL